METYQGFGGCSAARKGDECGKRIRQDQETVSVPVVSNQRNIRGQVEGTEGKYKKEMQQAWIEIEKSQIEIERLKKEIREIRDMKLET